MLLVVVSIPEKRETPFEENKEAKAMIAYNFVSIPEKRETPFEEILVQMVTLLW